MARLTEEQYTILANRIIEEHRKYADKLSPGEWAQIAARKVAAHMEDFREDQTIRSKQTSVICRASVLWFSGEMEKTLRDNDAKGGWGQCGHRWLLERLRQETDELESAMLTPDNQAEVIKEATDVANFAMMIADIAGPLHGR